MEIASEFKKYVTYQIYGTRYNKEPIHSCNIHWNRDKNRYWFEILPDGRKYTETVPYLFKYRLASDNEEFMKIIRGESEDWQPPEDLRPLDSDFLEYYLSDRVIPPNRDLLKQTLEAAGIYEYDWRVLIRLNHGRTIEDDNWVEVVESDKNPDPDGEY